MMSTLFLSFTIGFLVIILLVLFVAVFDDLLFIIIMVGTCTALGYVLLDVFGGLQ